MHARLELNSISATEIPTTTQNRASASSIDDLESSQAKAGGREGVLIFQAVNMFYDLARNRFSDYHPNATFLRRR